MLKAQSSKNFSHLDLGLVNPSSFHYAVAVKLGLISDTHGTVPNTVHAALAGVDCILHAGDVGPMDIITELEAIAPVRAVLGNTDFGIALPESRVEEFLGATILIHHIVDVSFPSRQVQALLAEAQPDIVVFGHTHMPCNERVDDVLYLNPGSPVTPRGDTHASVAVLDLADFENSPNGAPKVQHIALQ